MEDRRVTKTKMLLAFLVLYASTTCSQCDAAGTISASQTVRYNETIVSPQETFELGFFIPGNSTNHYVGIWYKKISIKTVVWVANRNAPLSDATGELTLTLQGVLILRDTTMGTIVWSSENSSTTSVRNPIGQLLDTGNFIIYEEGDDHNQEDPIWQSFDFMTDTLLAGMKNGKNLVTGIERYYTSWKSEDDPAAGDFSVRLDSRGYPELLLLRDGQEIKFRSGPWNGLRFSGNPNMKPNPIYKYTFVVNQREIYYQYNLVNTSVYTRLVVQPTGHIECLVWHDSKQKWDLYLDPESDNCDQYVVCGPFASCNIYNSPVCSCLKGFEPISPDEWRVADSTHGCRRTARLDCGPGDGF
ncbi:putative non-specific serine/threonine protein kinase [Helianthus annuus]|nr:putative non-specific serine/threonine protein kinase [Helianthus annuus]